MTDEWSPPAHWCQKCLADPNEGIGFYHIETCQSPPEDCPMKKTITKENYERVSKRVDELWGKLKGMTDDQYY